VVLILLQDQEVDPTMLHQAVEVPTMADLAVAHMLHQVAQVVAHILLHQTVEVEVPTMVDLVVARMLHQAVAVAAHTMVAQVVAHMLLHQTVEVEVQVPTMEELVAAQVLVADLVRIITGDRLGVGHDTVIQEARQAPVDPEESRLAKERVEKERAKVAAPGHEVPVDEAGTGKYFLVLELGGYLFHRK
jgi:hypothetical protein